MAVEVGAAESLHAVEITCFARHLHHPLHGAADHDDLAPGRLGGIGDGAQPRDIGGEGRSPRPGLLHPSPAR
jgi:hypothetical protein